GEGAPVPNWESESARGAVWCVNFTSTRSACSGLSKYRGAPQASGNFARRVCCPRQEPREEAGSGGRQMPIARAAALMAGILMLASANAANAQDTNGWRPQGNVEFVVGAGAGGENDRIARAIQHALTEEHIVDTMTVLNRPGAAQTIAINYLASKRGDANEIGLASGSFINAIARNGSTLHKSVTRLMKLFDAYQCYFTRVDSPIKDMADVRDRLRANPNSVTFAFPVGLGSPLHVSVVNVAKAAGAPPGKVVTVVYNSGSDVAAQ